LSICLQLIRNMIYFSRFFDDNSVDIWYTELSRSPLKLAELSTILAPDERLRAEKFKLEIHRNRFISARGILRQILSLYLDLASDKIKFSYSDRGKPSLVNNLLNIQFNLSHSENIAVYAVTKNKKIGIDIEYLEEKPDCLNIARRFFSSREFEAIEGLTRKDRSRLFFQLWTAKEAYLKATGEGLSGSLDKVEISSDNGRSTYSINGKINPNWHLEQLDLAEDYLATVAVEIKEEKPLIFSYNFL
jgi:4'-phosphopantetheinyl transferase